MDSVVMEIEGSEVINGRKVVKKHVAAIHCSNKLSLLERKISNALLYNAFPDLKNQLIHSITIEQLKRLLSCNTRNHNQLKRALKKLISTVLEWNLLGDNVPELDLDGWNASTILSSVTINRGVIKYQYSELIKSLISDPKMYGKVNLAIQSRFRSSYALALYENCSRYRGLSHTKNFDYSLFRKLMGVEAEEYGYFNDFNRRVLNPAVTEINTCSDIRVSPEITKRGRKVVSIMFRLEERPMMKRIGGKEREVEGLKKGHKLSEEFCIDEPAFSKLLSKYGESRVDEAAKYVRSRPKYKSGEIKNIGGYLNSTLKNGYQEKTSVNNQPSAEEIERKKLEISRQKWVSEQKEEYRRYLSRQLMNVFVSLDENRQIILVDEYLKISSKNGSYSEIYYQKLGNDKNRLSNAIELGKIEAQIFFESGFCDHLISSHIELKENKILSFDEYLEIATEPSRFL